MTRSSLSLPVLLAFLAVSPVTAADFSFFSIIRAGVAGAGDWEIGTGANGNTISTGAQFSWPNDLDQRFRIGYNQSTNTAYTTVWNSANVASTSNYNPVGGAPSASNRTWTVRAGAIYTSATPLAVTTSVKVSGLQLGNGLPPGSALNILQPLTSTSLSASQPSPVAPSSNSAPIIFSAATTGGDWYIDGNIRFSGLASFVTSGAQRSQLHFGLTAVASDTPEPAAILLVSGGLATLAYLKRRGKGVPA